MKKKLILAAVLAGFIGLLVLNTRSAEPKTLRGSGLENEIKRLDPVATAGLEPNTDPALLLQLLQVQQLKRIADALEKMESREARREQERK